MPRLVLHRFKSCPAYSDTFNSHQPILPSMADYSENYYLREFRKLQNKDSFRAQQWFGQRGDLVETYSWAIPNEEAISYIAELSPIVEIGAGKGYWAWMLQDAGASVRPIDIDPPEETWTTVYEGTEEMLQRINGEPTLLLCWPPYGEPMAREALDTHAINGGTDVVYIGEGMGGCTGDDVFHETLDERYALMKTIDIPSYEGIHDAVFHYKRKI
ncbi:AdoMet-MTase [Halogranum tailed virus 1]|uniref:AdoMet-MTase n=1 Tax=Halogranum tailed virus 1 TaxID=1273749 RepID=R4TML4_9CAUD|nr:AdoMet-MTase [Halogranum tailed virus 1]AGM11393.1 AdoMet-MTase [Halogranum tailed virus 1]